MYSECLSRESDSLEILWSDSGGGVGVRTGSGVGVLTTTTEGSSGSVESDGSLELVSSGICGYCI